MNDGQFFSLLRCPDCGENSSPATSDAEAVKLATEAGWVRLRYRTGDYEKSRKWFCGVCAAKRVRSISRSE